MSRQTNPIEKQANDFAMQLLMPEDMVRKAVNEGVRNVGMLADRFGVPSTRMKERLSEFGYTFNKL